MKNRISRASLLWLVSAILAVGPLLRTALTAPSGRDEDRDRGDVPGWVMITVMTVADGLTYHC